jgi:RNA polymerase sigma-70 factor, ECF subfamily
MAHVQDWPSTRETLIVRLQEQSGGPAWDLFAEVYVPLIYRFCRRRGVQDADAHDVTQSVFLLVRKGIQTLAFDPAKGKFRSWLGTVSVREIMRHKQRSDRAGRPTAAATDGLHDSGENDAGWIVAFNSHVCQAALDRIRPEFDDKVWSAFGLLWGDDVRPAEVAERMQASPAWVYQVKYRVLKRLEREVRFLTADMPAFARESGG